MRSSSSLSKIAKKMFKSVRFPITIISKKKKVAPNPALATVRFITSFQFSPVNTMNTVRHDYPILSKLYRTGSPSSSSSMPEKNYLPISAFMKMNKTMRRPRFADAGAEDSTTYMTFLRLSQVRISLKILIKRKPRKTDTPLDSSEEKVSVRERITIMPSNMFIASSR